MLFGAAPRGAYCIDIVRGIALPPGQSMNPLELSDSFALYVHCDPSIKSVAWISDDHSDFEM